MKVNIYRDSTAQCPERILIGEFNDIYHPTVFLRSMLDESLSDGMTGAFIVEYDFRREGRENEISN